MKDSFRKGFTLIEVMIVIVIIGVIMAVSIPSVSGYIKNARSSEIKNGMILAMREIIIAQSIDGTGIIPGLEGCFENLPFGTSHPFFMRNENNNDWFLYAGIACYNNPSAPWKYITKDNFPKKYVETIQKIVNSDSYLKEYNPGICAGKCPYIFYMTTNGESKMANYIAMPNGKWLCVDNSSNVIETPITNTSTPSSSLNITNRGFCK